MKKFLYILFIVFVVLPCVTLAQVKDKIEKAYTLYNAGELEQAAKVIDEVVAMPDGNKSKVAWHIRGFIYKDIYVEEEQDDIHSPAREEALKSHRNSIKNDPEQTLVEQNRKAIRYLSISYYNDAIEVIEQRDPKKIDNADKLYNTFKEITVYLFPDSILTEKDKEFYLAMSTAHRKIFERDRNQYDEHFDISDQYLDKVLEIDPDNWAALYSKSVAFYNRGVYNLDRLPEAQGITDIYTIEAESMRSIQIALPFMFKAYKLNPEKIETVKGLKTIYQNLDREEESNQMRELEMRLEENKK